MQPKPRKPWKPSERQLQVMALMAEGEKAGNPPDQVEIAERLGVRKQWAGNMVRDLELRGVVTPVRVVPNQLTDLGRELLKAAKRGRR